MKTWLAGTFSNVLTTRDFSFSMNSIIGDFVSRLYNWCPMVRISPQYIMYASGVGQRISCRNEAKGFGGYETEDLFGTASFWTFCCAQIANKPRWSSVFWDSDREKLCNEIDFLSSAGTLCETARNCNALEVAEHSTNLYVKQSCWTKLPKHVETGIICTFQKRKLLGLNNATPTCSSAIWCWCMFSFSLQNESLRFLSPSQPQPGTGFIHPLTCIVFWTAMMTLVCLTCDAPCGEIQAFVCFTKWDPRTLDKENGRETDV